MARALVGIIGALSADRCAELLGRMLDRIADRNCTREIVSAPELGVHVGLVSRRASETTTCAIAGEAAQVSLMLAGDVRLPSDGHDRDDDSRTTHILLEHYRILGPRFVEELNGLFAGVLIDRRAGVALLFNDRYGAERIYLHHWNGLVYFASEAKALLSILPQARAFDDAGLRDFLKYGSTLFGRTLFRGISMLPGATLWRIEGPDGHIERSRYFDAQRWEAQSALPADEFMEVFSSTFHRILPSYLTSSRSIGFSITAGLDTRMIMACLPARQVPTISYTYAGECGETLDCRIGARVAGLRGLEHRILRVGRDFLSDYRGYVDRTVFATDGAAGALQAHEIYFSALARQLAPIRLTGNFGSEVLRGISTFKPMGLDRNLLNPQFLSAAHALTAEEESAPVHPVTHAAFREIPWHLFGTVTAARTHLTFRTPYMDNEVVQLAYRAPVQLRRSSEPALRLLRNYDPRLSSIATDRGVSAHPGRLRAIARRAAAEITFKLDYMHKEGLPNWLSPFDAALGSMSAFGLLGWHKFLPYRGWFRRELAGATATVLDDASRRGLDFLDRDHLKTLVPMHVQGRKNNLLAIHTVATLEAVDRLLLRESRVN